MRIQRVWVINIVKIKTDFEVDSVLHKSRSIDIYTSFIEYRPSVYRRHFTVMQFDQESGFTFEGLRNTTTVHGLKLYFSESQTWNFSTVEKLSRATEQGFFEFYSGKKYVEWEIRIYQAVKNLNELIGSKELVS